ncbi:MAG: hypothetical protein FJ147_11785 [Deltaproteobacteria bacterium]|nr:hypothetical protein [Deltaproteobacteria bacterium]
MPLNAFIVRPFEEKELVVTAGALTERLKENQDKLGCNSIVRGIEQIGGSSFWKAKVNFDVIERLLLSLVLSRLNIRGETAAEVVVAGNIREDMFHQLLTTDIVIADLSYYNPNVFYELGIRQAFRDKFTFLIRSNLSEYPFDLKTDRYFEYDVIDLDKKDDKTASKVEETVDRLVKALRATISSYKADSPVFKLLPKLVAEDRSRFITVPDEFREEVQRARRHKWSAHLRLLAVECEGFLWEIEGLREVGRAQFESNFISGAKTTWEAIATRYPDDTEANTTLSTIYQRLHDVTRSEQALARISRIGTLSASDLSQIRSLNGRNLKEAWGRQWSAEEKATLEQRQENALRSPLLQRAYDAYEEAFKIDLNNSYAGLNALSLLVIQTELADKYPSAWRNIQRRPEDAGRELELRKGRIRQLIATLELALESHRERLRREGVITDVWFSSLEAAVACLVSDQPKYVRRLYEEVKHLAPEIAEQSIRNALSIYPDLGIRGRKASEARKAGRPGEIGTIEANVEEAIAVLDSKGSANKQPNGLKRTLMFASLRLNHSVPAFHKGAVGGVGTQEKSQRLGFPEECVKEVGDVIAEVIQEENRLNGTILFGIAAGANGGDLLFHEACRKEGIPTHLCLALPRDEYVGQYVAPAGKHWVKRFRDVYYEIRNTRQRDDDPDAPLSSERIKEFADTNGLPRWLQSKPYYNVGRRNNLWILEYAIMAANQFEDSAEVTLIVLWDDHQQESEPGPGGIRDLLRRAEKAGIKVHRISVPRPENKTTKDDQPVQSDQGNVVRLRNF